MAVEELTKKEQIINFAQSDPFLKISDIAEYVQTTPRYVRTILSEANISLMKLREKYARSMEKRLQTHDDLEVETGLKLKPLRGSREMGKLEITQLLDEEHEGLQKMGREEKLWRVNQVYCSGGKPFCVKELVAFFNIDLMREKIESLDYIYQLFSQKGISHLQYQDSLVKVEKPEEYVRQLLEMKADEKVMVVTRYILMNKIPIAVENYYFCPDKVEMRITGKLIM